MLSEKLISLSVPVAIVGAATLLGNTDAIAGWTPTELGQMGVGGLIASTLWSAGRRITRILDLQEQAMRDTREFQKDSLELQRKQDVRLADLLKHVDRTGPIEIRD